MLHEYAQEKDEEVVGGRGGGGLSGRGEEVG